MNLLPKDDIFFDLFVNSSNNVYDAAVILQEMVNSNMNQGLLETKAKKVKEIEDGNDSNTHKILTQLNKSFVTPLDREDIYQIAKELDEIIDSIEDAAYWIMSINAKEIRSEAKTLCDLILRGSVEIQKIMKALKATKNVKELSANIIEVNRIENEGDTIYREVLKRLFSDNISAIEVIEWKEVFGFLEDALDACEHVANTIEGVVMKHA